MRHYFRREMHGVTGYQRFYIEADTPEEAREKYKTAGTRCAVFVEQETDVSELGDPEWETD